MSKTIEMQAELAERILAWLNTDEPNDDGWVSELRGLLAAPVVERQEPVAYRYVHDYEHGNGWQRNATDFCEAEHFEHERADTWRKITPLYTSPPAPVAVAQSIQLTRAELALLQAVWTFPGCKLNGDEYCDEETGRHAYSRLEDLGLIQAVGSYKWKPAIDADFFKLGFGAWQEMGGFDKVKELNQ